MSQSAKAAQASKDLERLTDEDLEAAAEAIAHDTDDPTVAKIHVLATKWVYDMLEEHPEKLPPTFAIKLFLDLEKAKAAKEITPDEETVEVSVLDRIDALPRDHAAELLKREIERLDQRRAEFFAALEQLTEAT